MIYAVLGLSLTLQVVAIVLAARLRDVVASRRALTVFLLMLALMAARRAIIFGRLLTGEPAEADLLAESLALAISAMLVVLLPLFHPRYTVARRASDTLIEKEALFRLLTEAAFEGIAVAEEGRFVEVSEQFARLFGYQQKDLIGTSVEKLIAPEYRQDALVRIEAGYDHPYESMCLRKDGSRFPVEVCGKNYSLDRRKLRVTAVRDITQRRATEDQIRRLKELNEYVIQNMLEGVVVEDADGCFTLINASAAKLLGYRQQELVGQHWSTIIPPDQFPVVEAANRRRKEGRSDRYELEVLGKNNRRIPTRVSGSPIFEGDEFAGTIAVFTDLSARKQRERELSAIVAVSTALRQAIERSQMLPIILDQLFELLQAEGAAFAARDPETGETVIEVAQGVWMPWLGERLPAGEGVSGYVIERGKPYLSEHIDRDHRFARPDLLAGLSALICVPLVSHDETLGALLVGRHEPFSASEERILTAIADMTANALRRASLMETLELRVRERTSELEKAYQQLQEFDRMKSDFVSNVSHELRTPITNILLYLDLLQKPIRKEKRKVYMGILRGEAHRLGTLIEDLLTLSRLEQEQFPMQRQPHALDALIEEVLAAHHAKAQAKKISIQHEDNAHLPPVMVDREQMIQVITNLVTNAVAYTQPGGEVSLTTFADRTSDTPYIALRVHNNGPLIPEEDLPHLFERFFRGETGRASGEPGTGLGLSICKEIVERHGGWIDVTSDAKHGTSFTVRLPLPAAPLATTS